MKSETAFPKTVKLIQYGGYVFSGTLCPAALWEKNESVLVDLREGTRTRLFREFFIFIFLVGGEAGIVIELNDDSPTCVSS